MDQTDQIHLPVVGEKGTINDLACGLRAAGLTAAELREGSRDPAVLKAMAEAAIAILRPPTFTRFERPGKQDVERFGLKEAHHSLIRVHGVTKHKKVSFAGLFPPGVIADMKAREILESEDVLGTDESTLYTFRVVPTRPFAVVRTQDDIMYHQMICALFRAAYPKFKQDHVDPSVIVGLLREKQKLTEIMRVQNLMWLVLLHRPITNLCKEQCLLEIHKGEGQRLTIRSTAVRDDTIWGDDGAFLLISH